MLPGNSKKILFYQNGLTNSENDSINVYTLGVGSRLVAEWIIVAKGLRDIERRVSENHENAERTMEVLQIFRYSRTGPVAAFTWREEGRF
ncbi:hypothetical protein K0M31_005544 [Melipona bicolor]|uniref:Uncharacterized protein n=1 Tax=Melipona bicolor TaxID=60889 RepID=A0AA40FV84_9HYME|nr:hypothetical protein K0M31_005544 [Melipona bicolor]